MGNRSGVADRGRLGRMPALSPLNLSLLALAAVLPARESTGALLVLLILGDLFAVWTYHAHADWAVLRRLVPTVLAGVLVGTFFLAVADDGTVRRVIGVTLLVLVVLVVLTLVRRAAARGSRDPSRLDAAGSAAGDVAPPADRAAGRRWRGRFGTGGYGVLAGFTTMVANAGGPVMSMYFLASRFSISRFLGTAAWFFFAVNLAKNPVLGVSRSHRRRVTAARPALGAGGRRRRHDRPPPRPADQPETLRPARPHPDDRLCHLPARAVRSRSPRNGWRAARMSISLRGRFGPRFQQPVSDEPAFSRVVDPVAV